MAAELAGCKSGWMAMTCCQVLHLNRDECLRQAEGGGRASGKPRVVDVPQASRGWWLCLRQAEGGREDDAGHLADSRRDEVAHELLGADVDGAAFLHGSDNAGKGVVR